ncbi:MAG: hypothetical protein ACI849_000162 [Patiriisocius sp.]|jgi:uncharacterized protein YciI
MKKGILLLVLSLLVISCNDTKQKSLTASTNFTVAQQIEKLKADGFEIFDYVDEETGDTVIMQQYYMAFLSRGENQDQSKEALDSLQKARMAHLSHMYEAGFADISGPFGDDDELRGITIYNVATLKTADSLAKLDPMVKAGRLQVEIKPWWASKGYLLR